MKIFKLFVSAAIAAAALASLGVATASATTLNLATGYPIFSEAEGTTVLHSPLGEIQCGESKVEGTITNEGGSTETVKGSIDTFTFGSCNATVTVLKKGTLELHTSTESANNNGTLTSSGAEITVSFSGFHCIFSTNNTDLGTVTGSETTGSNATLDIQASIPRTGGSSGFFCGSSAQWTGSYKVTAPNPLNVDGNSGEVIALDGGAGTTRLTGKVGDKYTSEWENNTDKEMNIDKDKSTNEAVAKTEGTVCGKIPVNKICKTRTFTCLEKGESVLIIEEGNYIRGMVRIKCD